MNTKVSGENPGIEIGSVDNHYNGKASPGAEYTGQRIPDRAELAMMVANDGMWDWDLRTDTVYFDSRYYTMAGYEVDEFPHTLEAFQQRVHPEDIDRVMENAARHISGDIDRFIVEFRFLNKDGGWQWILGRGQIIHWDEQGQPTRFIGTHTDITRQKLAEEALRESEEKYRHLIQHSGEAIYLLYNRRFELINDKFQELFGVTLEDVNKESFDFIQLVSPKSRPMVEQRILRQKRGEELEPTYEFIALDAKGEELEVEATVTYVKYKEGYATQGILRDITRHKRLENQLRQAQKMEAIGQLAGGVAHDFNNLLTVINGYCEILTMRNLPGDLREYIEQIKNAGKRAAQLTSQLLAFSRKQIIQPKVINLNKLIMDYLKILGRLLGENISIISNLHPALGNIKADPVQIEQVIMNIAINARDAMPLGGQLVIETNNRIIDDEYVRKHPGSEPGDFIMLAIHDNGAGMDAATVSHIFEPFFTTKGREKGTGLGLATVYGIVKQNKGFIDVVSEMQKGTSIRIYIPKAESAIEEPEIRSSSDSDLPRHETILLVEDDPGVRAVTSTTLKNYGYSVLIAADGEEALRIYHTTKKHIDLLLTDVVMPAMSGRELAEHILMDNPNIKVLYFSGYDDENIARHGILGQETEFLQKPFSQTELVNKIQEILQH